MAGLKDAVLLLPCECHTHISGFTFVCDCDDDGGGEFFVTYGVRYAEGENLSLRDRLRSAWNVLRGRHVDFNEIVLSKENALRLSDYITRAASEGADDAASQELVQPTHDELARWDDEGASAAHPVAVVPDGAGVPRG